MNDTLLHKKEKKVNIIILLYDKKVVFLHSILNE